MGIVEELLATYSLSTGQDHRIEVNAGGSIHLHMGNIKLNMTIEEFEEFAAVIDAAANELEERKSSATRR